MRILVISATENEIQPTSNLLAESGGMMQGNLIEILITGLGAVNTAYHLTKKMNTQSFDLAIQAGVAGAFNTEIELGQTVVVKSDAFADLGMEAQGNFETIFQAGFCNADAHPFKGGLLVNNQYTEKITLPVVSAVSVNRVTDNVDQKQQLIDIFNPAIESMEGAAFHYVCLQENVSFIQLRAISNYVGERNKTNWKLKEAIVNLNKALESLIRLQP